MATRTWNSTSSGAFATAGNWEEASAPTAGDDVWINAGASIDGSDQNAYSLNSFSVGRDYAGQIASSGTYLEIDSDDVSLNCGSNARDIYIDIDAADSGDTVRIDSLSSIGTVFVKAASGSSVAELVINHGRVKLVSGTFAAVYVEWDGTGTRPSIEIESATVTAWYGATDHQARTTAAGTVTTAYQDAGKLQMDAGTLTNAYLRGRGKVDYRSANTITLLEVFSGAEFVGTNDPRPKTITTMRLHQGGVVNLLNGNPDSFTLTTSVYYGLARPLIQS